MSFTLSDAQAQEAQRQEALARTRRLVRLVLNYGVMIFLCFIFLFPIVFMIVAAFKQNARVIADLASIQAFFPPPDTLTLDNIRDVFARVPFGRYVLNSVIIAFVTVFAGLFVNSMAAFVLARLRWPGRGLVLGIVVSLIIIPIEAIAVPLLIQVNNISNTVTVGVLAILGLVLGLMWSTLWSALGKQLAEVSMLKTLPGPVLQGLRLVLTLVLALPVELLMYYLIEHLMAGRSSWLNSYHVQILPFIAEPFSIFLFYQFFIGIPKDFDEAAYVDGASAFRVYWQIIVPLSRPVFATVAILKFLQFYAFYLWPLITTRSDNYRPLMVGMDFFQTQEPIRWGSIMAYAAMVTVPVLIVFLIFQRWFVQSVSSSGVKG